MKMKCLLFGATVFFFVNSCCCLLTWVCLAVWWLKALQMTFEQKNPKNQVETLNWLSGAIRQFGLKWVVISNCCYF